MWPNTQGSALPLSALEKQPAIFDTVYNPIRTQLLNNAASAGCKSIDGLSMFIHQAAAQYEIWFGRKIDIKAVRRNLEKRLAVMNGTSQTVEALNIVLVGYRGCGKSTVGKILARKLGRPLVDTDNLVQEQAGTSITDIFAAESESGFRHREAQVIARVTESKGQIVAVGGGAILGNRQRWRTQTFRQTCLSARLAG